jgi:hypothetical protein
MKVRSEKKKIKKKLKELTFYSPRICVGSKLYIMLGSGAVEFGLVKTL